MSNQRTSLLRNRLLPASAILACLVGLSSVSSLSAAPGSTAADQTEFAPFVPQGKKGVTDELNVSPPPGGNSPINPGQAELFPF
jgi:hypothetical protein